CPALTNLVSLASALDQGAGLVELLGCIGVEERIDHAAVKPQEGELDHHAGMAACPVEDLAHTGLELRLQVVSPRHGPSTNHRKYVAARVRVRHRTLDGDC